MKILITGAAGFIGRHFEAALAEDHEVFGFDLNPGHGQIPVDALDVFAGDNTHFDLVVHCAAVEPHRAAIDNTPLAVGAGNLALDAAMFSWAARTRPGRVVYLSSCAVYPARPRVAGPMVEDDVARPQPVHQPDTYTWVKHTGERLASHYRSEGGVVTVVRPFSGYGSDQDVRFPFGAFVDRARHRADPFTIWGDGQQVRDWVHVDDIVGAVLAAVEQDVDGPVNIGTGKATTLNELAGMVCQQAGYSPEFEYRIDAPTGPSYRVADTTRLEEFYTPRVALEAGVARALA